jgi:molybdopterin molybdotransferase
MTLEEGQERILADLPPLPSEEIPLSNALARFLAAPVRALVDLPSADNSAMDGYAVRADDLKIATTEKPVTLRLAHHSQAGAVPDFAVEPGECARIFTGAALPPGADAIVMQEDVKKTEGDPVNMMFSEAVKPWENVRVRGEDVHAGTLLLESGEELTAPRLSLLAAAGIARVSVGRRPTVGLLATGNELCEAGRPLAPGQIYESHSAGLSALALSAGAAPKIYPPVRDDLAATKQALQKAFQECDVVVTSGGVSVGEMDWIKPAFTEIGGQMDFWQIAIKPGKPFAFGRREGKLLCGLPGNPVSAFVTFFLLVRPALLRLQGAREVRPPVSWGTLAEAINNRGDRRHFVRVTIDRDGAVRSTGNQASNILSSLARADGLIDMPPKASWPAGTRVAVLRWTR